MKRFLIENFADYFRSYAHNQSVENILLFKDRLRSYQYLCRFYADEYPRKLEYMSEVTGSNFYLKAWDINQEG